MIIGIIIISVLVLVEKIYSPRFDFTEDEELILWYGRLPNRKYFKIEKQ